MFVYQIKLVIKENKIDEFIDCLLSMSGEFRKAKGFLDVRCYRNIEKENTYIMIGEWRTRQAMEKHFKNKHFKNKHFLVLIGAVRVLAETYEMNIGEISKKEALNWQRKDHLVKKERAAIE